MPLETRSRSRAPFAPELDLPPPFTLVTLREVGDAFAHAKKIAAEIDEFNEVNSNIAFKYDCTYCDITAGARTPGDNELENLRPEFHFA